MTPAPLYPEAAPSPAGAAVGPTSPTMEGSRPALPAEPGTLKATLMDLPGIDKMTEKETAHPSQR